MKQYFSPTIKVVKLKPSNILIELLDLFSDIDISVEEEDEEDE